MLSRIIYGARISLTIGLVGIAFSFMLGIVIGGLAGYYGGIVRPHRPAHHRGAAVDPAHSAVDGAGGNHAGDLEPAPHLFRHHHLLGLLDWTGLARAVRSKLLALREEDYVLAAQLMGAKTAASSAGISSRASCRI